MRAVSLLIAWLAVAGQASGAPKTCTPQLCGKYLPDGVPERPCTCFGGGLGCCRFPKGCVCELECAQFGDCCAGAAGMCDRPIVTSIAAGALRAGDASTSPETREKLRRFRVRQDKEEHGPEYTVRGPNLGGTWLQVKVGAVQCRLLEVRSDHISFALPAGTPPAGKVVVIVDGRASTPVELPPLAGGPAGGK
jgi:hypothetical protein